MSSLIARVRSGVPDEIIGPDATPYMLRWFVFKHRHWPRIYLHKFVRSDDDRALHDHPWWFVSLILTGTYLEYTQTVGNPHPRRRFSLAYRPATFAHRVALVSGFNPDGSYGLQPCWTIVLTGSKSREWGFWCPQGWRHWREFVGVRGCD